MARQRLDQLLVERGFFSDARSALGPIMAGNVVVDGKVVSAAGVQVKPEATIHIRGQQLRFASRGGYKLERALDSFQMSVEGAVVLDAGASTGGFTDCLLQRHAGKVYAVDVGFGQLRGKLAADPRVSVFEKTNIGDLGPQMIDEPLDLVTVDLSYLSLLQALPVLRDQLPPWPTAICLVKPLYEGLDQDKPADIEAIASVLKGLLDGISSAGFTVTDVCPSPVLGGRGAIEILIRVEPGEPVGADSQALVDIAVAAIRQEPPIRPENLS